MFMFHRRNSWNIQYNAQCHSSSAKYSFPYSFGPPTVRFLREGCGHEIQSNVSLQPRAFANDEMYLSLQHRAQKHMDLPKKLGTSFADRNICASLQYQALGHKICTRGLTAFCYRSVWGDQSRISSESAAFRKSKNF